MIDTINITLPNDAVSTPPLEGIRIVQSDWGTKETGGFRNLRISKSIKGVTILGSLVKFERFENVSNPTFQQCKNAIEHLCETFSFNAKDALLKRIDFAKTIKTQFNPKIYYPYLGAHRSYYRNSYKNSLNYSNSIRTLTFYDKGKEQNISSNLLRYEQRYFKPSQAFKRKIYLADLMTEEVYLAFLLNWQSDYNKIQKIKDFIPMKHFNSPKQFYSYMMAIAATQIGNDFLHNQLKFAQRTGILTKVNAKRIRDKINRINKSHLFESNHLVEELDLKVNQTNHL